MLTAGLQQASAEQMVEKQLIIAMLIEDHNPGDITEGERGTLSGGLALGAMAKETGSAELMVGLRRLSPKKYLQTSEIKAPHLLLFSKWKTSERFF